MDRPRAPLRSASRLALLAPPLAFLVVFFAWPVASIVGLGWDTGAVGDVLGDAGIRRVLWFTLWQAAASTALTLVLALPASHALARYDFRGRATVRALATVPFVLPTVVVGVAFRALLGGGTWWAIVIAHAFFNHAIVVRTVGGLWELLDPRTVEAARVLGATRRRAFVAVTLPALRPAIAAAAAITFLFSFTSFGVVKILGGPRLATLEVEIYRQTANLLDLRTAAVLSLLQLATIGALLLVLDRIERRTAAASRLGPAELERRRARTTGERAWLGANLAVMGAFLLVPLLVLVERSFRTSSGSPGLAAWRALADAGPLFVPATDAVRTSLGYAVVATIVAVVLGTLAAAGLARAGRRRWARAVDALLLVPLGVSAVTVGFGFLVALDTPPLDLRGSAALVPLAQALVALPFVVRTTLPVLRSIDGRLREAAAVLGASPAQVWREIDLPLVARAMAVAAGFAFAISLGEFGATTVIARADTPTLPVAIDRLLGRPGALNVAQAFAMATILMAVTATVVVVVDRVRGVRSRLL